MRKLTSFLARKWSWAREKPWAWRTVLVLFVTGLVLFFPGPLVDGQPSDARIRGWALALQLLGSGIALWDLARAAKSFDAPGLARSYWDWFLVGIGAKTRPRRTGSMTLDSGYAVASGGSAFVNVKAGSLADRVEWLERTALDLRERLDAANARAAQVEAAFASQLVAIRNEHAEAIGGLASQVKSVAIDGRDALCFGIFYVALGTSLAGLSPELALLLDGQWQAAIARFWR